MKKVIITENQLKSLMTETILANLIRQFMLRHMGQQLQGEKVPGQTGNTQNTDWRALIQNYLAKNGLGAENPGNHPKQPANQVSDGALSQICRWETSHDFGYPMSQKDLYGYYGNDNKAGKKTYGYGLLFHPNGKNYMEDVKPVWTQKELEQLFKQKVANEAQYVLNWAQKNGVTLGQGQLDAMVSAVYNFGRQGFINKGIPKMIAQDPDNPQIPQVWAHLSDAQTKRPGLKKRRETEANWYQSEMQQA